MHISRYFLKNTFSQFFNSIRSQTIRRHMNNFWFNILRCQPTNLINIIPQKRLTTTNTQLKNWIHSFENFFYFLNIQFSLFFFRKLLIQLPNITHSTLRLTFICNAKIQEQRLRRFNQPPHS